MGKLRHETIIRLFSAAVMLLSAGRVFVQAQADTVFWFASPQVQDILPYHNKILTHSTFYDEVTYTFEQPALGAWTIGSVPPYNSWFSHIEYNNGISGLDSICPYNAVSNYGYHYHGSGGSQMILKIENSNMGDYMLKGANALGTRFMIPAQWQFPNHSQYPEARNSVEVIATENNTVITVTPSVDLYGGTHPAGVPFNVSLNRGQVYCFAAASQSPEGHLGGTEIISNKPVAVDLTDDAVTYDGVHVDIICDQLIPEEKAGVDYIAMPASPTFHNTYNGQKNDYVLIYVLEDNTDVTVHNSGAPAQYSNLQRGDRRAYQFVDYTAAYISATKPVLVFQLTGGFGEPAGRMLTPLTCQGSRIINYHMQPNGINFNIHRHAMLTFFCDEAYINGFQMAYYIPGNGWGPFVPDETVPINTSYWVWQEIPGTTLRYTGLEATGSPCFYTQNSMGPFYTHVLEFAEDRNLNENIGTFCVYISDFANSSTLSWNTQAMPTLYCQGDSIFFSYTAENVDDIRIIGPDQQETTSDTLPDVSPEQSGYYVITGNSTTGCPPVLSDTIWLDISQDSLIQLQAEVCSGEPYQGHGFQVPAEETDSVGRIICDTLFLHSSHGCDSMVVLQLTVVEQPEVEISVSEGDFCDLGELVLTAVSEAPDYLWNTGDETPFISATHSGRYTVTASIGDCRATASTDIPNCDLNIYLPNAITPSRSDGLNDCLRLPESLPSKICDFSLSIYNRWGEQVFVTDDPHFSWCGEGAHISDVYVYQLRFKDYNGKPFVYRGIITVL